MQEQIVNNIEGWSRERTFSSKYYQPNPHFFCVFCQVSEHSSHACVKYSDSHSFWIKILQDRRCKNCLRLFHHSNNCFDKSLCNFRCNRRDKHSSVLCYVRDHLNYENHSDHSSKPMSPPQYISGYKPGEFSHDYFYPQSYRNGTYISKRSKRNNYRTEKVATNSQSCLTELAIIPKVNVSTQTEDLYEELGVDKISQTCQTEFERLVTANVQSSVDTPSTVAACTDPYINVIEPTTNSKQHLKIEDRIKPNYDNDENCCLVIDCDKLLNSIQRTQPKTAELFRSLKDLIFRFQQQKIYPIHSTPPI